MTCEDLAAARHQLICCLDGLEAIIAVANNGDDVTGVATCTKHTLEAATAVFEKLCSPRYVAALEKALASVDAGGAA
jgi:hypothetical protein